MLFHRSYAVALIAAALVACGGGGGDTSPTPTTLTVTCPDDSKQTAATLDLANSACPAPTLVSITPANNATGIAPESIATSGIVVATSSALTTPASSDVTLKAGGVTVPATVTMVGAKVFKVTPSAKLLYTQVYTYIANVKDSLGKNLSVSGGFTTASVSCADPLVPDSAGTSCVPPVCTAPAVWSGTSCEVPPATAWWPPTFVPVGTQVVGMNQLPANALLIGDTGWKQAVTDRVPKFLDSGMLLTGFNTRSIAFAFYKDQLGSSCATPIYKDDGSAVDNNKGVSNGCNTVDADWAVGTSTGVVRHFPSLGKCYQFSWNQTSQKFEDLVITCPF